MAFLSASRMSVSDVLHPNIDLYVLTGLLSLFATDDVKGYDTTMGFSSRAHKPCFEDAEVSGIVRPWL